MPPLLAAALLAGCEGYTYTLNERALYEPPALFSGYAIADAALADCVQQAIEDARVTRAEALEDLNCARAGIRDLAGIEVFVGLRRLGLDGNPLAGLAPLAALRRLEMLQLRESGLGTASEALCGTGVTQLALEGNPEFDCADLPRLRACGVARLEPPAHCAAAAQPRPG